MIIPRDSYGQEGLPRVGVAEMQAGDIIGFYGWSHVGLYAGNNQYVQAPHTGDVVKVSNLSGTSFAGVVRP
jgi:cell wall-associated NlpC family hydrolase